MLQQRQKKANKNSLLLFTRVNWQRCAAPITSCTPHIRNTHVCSGKATKYERACKYKCESYKVNILQVEWVLMCSTRIQTHICICERMLATHYNLYPNVRSPEKFTSLNGCQLVPLIWWSSDKCTYMYCVCVCLFKRYWLRWLKPLVAVWWMFRAINFYFITFFFLVELKGTKEVCHLLNITGCAFLLPFSAFFRLLSWYVYIFEIIVPNELKSLTHMENILCIIINKTFFDVRTI